jgi:hypothetical protein
MTSTAVIFSSERDSCPVGPSYDQNHHGSQECDPGGSLISISSYLSSFGFHFIATYTDLLTTDGGIFAVANLLMARNR